jgi:hypothetical protein
MALFPSQGKKPLAVRRGCKRSRLEAQLLAAAYEALCPIAKRPLPASEAGRRPNRGREETPDQPFRHAGGNQG